MAPGISLRFPSGPTQLVVPTCSSEIVHNCLWMQREHVTDRRYPNARVSVDAWLCGHKNACPLKSNINTDVRNAWAFYKENSSMDVTLFTYIPYELTYDSRTEDSWETEPKLKDCREHKEFARTGVKQDGFPTLLCAVLTSHLTYKIHDAHSRRHTKKKYARTPIRSSKNSEYSRRGLVIFF